MPRFQSQSQNPIPVVPFKNCYAKTAEDGTPGITVLEHRQNVAEVASALFDILPQTVRSLLPANVPIAAIVGAHHGGRRDLLPTRVGMIRRDRDIFTLVLAWSFAIFVSVARWRKPCTKKFELGLNT